MNDDPLIHSLRPWLREADRPAPDQRGSLEQVMAAVARTPQAGRWWPPRWRETRNAERDQRRDGEGGGGLRSAVSFSLAAAFIGLVGGAIVLGVAPDRERDDGLVPGGAASPTAPAIAWRTEVVALEADSLTLEVNDLTFTSVGAPVDARSDPGSATYWTLELRWTEHEREQRMNLYFASDGSDWWVSEVRTYDGHEVGEWVYADGPFFRTPLGAAFEGDVELDLLGEGRPGDDELLVPATLAIEGLRLSVTPRPDGSSPATESTTEMATESTTVDAGEYIGDSSVTDSGKASVDEGATPGPGA